MLASGIPPKNILFFSGLILRRTSEECSKSFVLLHRLVATFVFLPAGHTDVCVQHVCEVFDSWMGQHDTPLARVRIRVFVFAAPMRYLYHAAEIHVLLQLSTQTHTRTAFFGAFSCPGWEERCTCFSLFSALSVVA